MPMCGVQWLREMGLTFGYGDKSARAAMRPGVGLEYKSKTARSAIEGRSPPVMYPEDGIFLSNALIVGLMVSSSASFTSACACQHVSTSVVIASKVRVKFVV